MVCCGRCPCSVHLKCVGLKRAKDFQSCLHHRCAGCGKNRQSAGGLLYPCQACANAYCEDCLPKQGVTYLENVPRFDALGLDSANSKVVYIICSDQCHRVSKQEFGFVHKLSNGAKRKCPKAIDVSFGFGATKSLEEGLSELQKEQEAEINSTSEKVGRSGRVRPKIEARPQIKKKPKLVACAEYLQWVALPISDRAVEKVCLSTGKVLRVHTSFNDAAKTIPRSGASLNQYLRKQSPNECDGFLWKLTTVEKAREPSLEPSVAEGNDSCATTICSISSSDCTSTAGKVSPPDEKTTVKNEAQDESKANCACS